VLDWGGSGEVMVLLTGSGDNAHVFDYFAFQFTDFFHVIGITRRGWLPSSQPKNGYDVETRAADDVKVLDALGIKKAVFVGHSIAGSELSKIAVKYPSYVDKLVYLDASDISGWYSDVISKFGEEHPGNPKPVAYLLPGAAHYVYINNEAEVVRQMQNFLGIPLVRN
jgi:pimeloyl-ACP methyl ester carboxylesterase